MCIECETTSMVWAPRSASNIDYFKRVVTSFPVPELPFGISVCTYLDIAQGYSSFQIVRDFFFIYIAGPEICIRSPA